MTYQPPPGNTPPPPPPGSQPGGQWGPPPGGPGKPAFDPKTVNPLDWGIMGIGIVLFLFSFFGYYTFDYGFASGSFGAWHTSGGLFVAWFAMIIGVLSAGAVAAAIFAPHVKLPAEPRMISTGGFGLSFLLYVIAIFAHSVFGPDSGHGFSFWLSLILALIGGVLSLMRFQQTGGQLPGGMNSKVPNIGGYGPQGGVTGGQYPYTQPGPGNAPPPPPGYGPPSNQ